MYQHAETKQDDVDIEQEDAAAEDEEEQEASWQQMLWDAVNTAGPVPQFACSGLLGNTAQLSACPEVTVDGLGRLVLPLSSQQALSLKEVAEQAPHGKGLRTVVDTAVRDAFQVDASKVSIGSSWHEVLQQLVSKAAAALGLSDGASSNIEPRLYKLLLYEQGGHFSAHQDTEKEPGMLGTLVVQLPCAQGHTGGILTIRHKGQTHTCDFAKDSARSLQHVAFFADCEHELSAITSGMRLVLVYNLVWVGQGSAPGPPKVSTAAQAELRRALQAWEADLAAGGRQKRIAFLLGHEYTEANLSFQHLKGKDRAMANVLSACRGFDTHLVLVTRTITENAEDDYAYGYNKRCCPYVDVNSDDEGEEEEHGYGGNEILEDFTETGKWVARDGSCIDYGSIKPKVDFWDPDGNKLIDPSKQDPDDEIDEGYTGNEGATIDKIYKRALLVIWPRSQTLSIASRAGFSALQSLLNLRMQEAAALHASSSRAQGQQQQQQSAGDDSSCKDQQQQQLQQQAAAAAGDSKSCRLHKVHREVAATLSTCARSLEKRLKQPAQQSYPQIETKSSEQATFVLQQGVKAVQLGAIAGAEAVQMVVAAVAGSPQGLLRDEAIAAALAAAAGVLGAADAAPLLKQLVSSSMTAHPSSCIILISKGGSQLELQHQLAHAAVAAVGVSSKTAGALVSLVAAVPGLPAVQQEVTDNLVTATLSHTSAQTALELTGFLHMLDPMPQLQHKLTAAVATAVVAAGPAANLSSCIPLLQACKQQPQVLEQFVQAVAADLRSTGATWEVSTAVQLLPCLQETPVLHKLLTSAVAERLFTSSGLLAAQTDDSMLQLSDMLLTNPQLRAASYDHYAGAVEERPDSHKLLQQLLQSGSLRANLAMPEAQQLVACQVANLQQLSAVPPFSWCMPHAKLPAYPMFWHAHRSTCDAQVESFLHGPNQTLALSGYSGIKQARETAGALSRGCKNSSSTMYSPTTCVTATYSFTVSATGIGKGAQVHIYKTHDWYESFVRKKQLYEQELQAVKELQR